MLVLKCWYSKSNVGIQLLVFSCWYSNVGILTPRMLLDMVPIIGACGFELLSLCGLSHMLHACFACVCHVEAQFPYMLLGTILRQSEALVVFLELCECGL